MMNRRGKSDSAIVAGKPTNKAGQPAAESVEPRAEAEGNASQQSTRRAQDRESVSQALERIRQVARQRKKERFTSLFHHISVELLRVAFFALKRDAAPGVDGLTWQDYEADLDRKIEDLHARVHFDSVSQQWLIRFLKHRINDTRMLRLIQKWLKAGVLEDGVVTVSDMGTGQGSVISPLLANVYLHYVFDLWAERWRHREAVGNVIIVRYADDLIIGFELDKDARRFQEAMCDRLREFSLSLHPEKTRLIEFGRFAVERRAHRRLGKPETFNFLGFTFICGTSSGGQFQIKRKTRRDRMRAKLKEIKEEMRQRRHHSIPEQGHWLRQVVTGFFAYHAVPTNIWSLGTFRFRIIDLWRRSLRRRSQKDGTTWRRITKLANDFLPRARILHPWPQERFAVKYPRWEPSARMGPARFCAGGAQ